MIGKSGVFRVTGLAFMIILVTAFPALGALSGPFLGPPPNATPGEVDGGHQAYPKLSSGSLGDATVKVYFHSPWVNCENETAFTVDVSKTAGTTAARTGGSDPAYNTFTSAGRIFTLDKTDGDGKVIGGSYEGACPGPGLPKDNGTLELKKSSPGLATYDRVHLEGERIENGSLKPVSWTLDFVEMAGQIAVQNIVQLGVINPCTQGGVNVDANSQIWAPLGTGDDGQPRVILDIDGDGVADDPYFGVFPGVSGYVSPGPTPIPTLTEWGLGILTVFFLILGLRYSRKKSFHASV